MLYEVAVAQDDFTMFIGRKSFWFYKNALKYAIKNIENFDFIWIEKPGGISETIKEKHKVYVQKES